MPTASGFPTVQERRRKDSEAIEKARQEEQLKRDEEARELAAQQQKEKAQLEQAAPLLEIPVRIAEEFLRDSLGLKGATFGGVELARFGAYSMAGVNGQELHPRDYPCRIYESRPWRDELAGYLDRPEKMAVYLGEEGLEQHRRDRYTNRPGPYLLGDGYTPWWSHLSGMMAVCLGATGLLQVYTFGLSASADDFQLLADAISKRTGMKVYITQFGDIYHPWNFTPMAVASKTSASSEANQATRFWPPRSISIFFLSLFLVWLIVLIILLA